MAIVQQPGGLFPLPQAQGRPSMSESVAQLLDFINMHKLANNTPVSSQSPSGMASKAGPSQSQQSALKWVQPSGR